MIASLRGRVLARGENYLVLEVGGIGYQVHIPTSLLIQLGTLGGEVLLYTHLHVRENELTLYGFGSEEELTLFNFLLGVNGVGPKSALAILSVLPPDAFRSAVATGDSTILQRVPGIGKKTAERIILDLKDKVIKEGWVPVPASLPAEPEVVAALTSLGYSLTEVRQALASLPKEEMPVEEKVMLALRHLGRE
ncbi:MAG: Holliday junction branch migration protein RuvA [Chloroflexi bacterium]|nr:Holliday junction branch migration protein RuvA [Chloroflexota bacterium]